MLSASTKSAVLRRLEALRSKYAHINLDISLVENLGGLRGFLTLPSGITPEEWDCDPDFYDFEKELAAGNGLVVAVWDEGAGEKVSARTVDDFNAFIKLDRLGKKFPAAARKKR